MRWGMLADDLTGSMDAGVRALGSRLAAGVCLEPDRLGELLAGLDLVVLDTESRNLAPQDAAGRVRDAVSALRRGGARLLYKKIDSTLRGNLGAELDAVLDAGAAPMIVVAPALPYNGRVTRAGTAFVDGVPLAETEFASDPFSPLPDSHVPALIGRQSRHPVATVGLAGVRSGGLEVRLRQLREAGTRIVVADAETESDLALIARSALAAEGVLACGSAGLFDRLVPLLPADAHAATVAPRCFGPLLVLSGSPSRVSKAQVARAEADGLVAAIRLDGRLVEAGARAAETDRVARLAAAALARGADVAVDAAGAGKAEILRAHGGDARAILTESALVQAALAAVVERLLAGRVRPGALALFGGETALGICRLLGAAGLRIAAEVEPFVPCGFAVGGTWDGLPIVTKAGGFGSERVVENALRLLRAP